MYQSRAEENHDGGPLAMSADSRNREPVQSNDELCLLRAEAGESKNALLDAREMAERAQDRAVATTETAERDRREQRVMVERLDDRVRRTPADRFCTRSSRTCSQSSSRRVGCEPAQRSGEDSKEDPPVGKL
ncbi:unnamed protein product [Peronospora farinosa]|uniref:Uncharacterized protein n=1 Tax=Peronospora farinosa TaxID=134698 RepID=A0AAV0SV00_9STRA|nr:unnamed protein product [Peronospora farinosa]